MNESKEMVDNTELIDRLSAENLALKPAFETTDSGKNIKEQSSVEQVQPIADIIENQYSKGIKMPRVNQQQKSPLQMSQKDESVSPSDTSPVISKKSILNID